MTRPIGWGAVATLARHELRHHWRALVVLGIGFGVFAGLALAVSAVLWRTDSAPARLIAASRPADIQITTYNQFQDPGQKNDMLSAVGLARSQLRGDPAVASVEPVAGYVGKLAGNGVAFTSIVAPQDEWGPVSTPVVVAGRMVHPNAVHEVLIEESRAADLHVRIGQTLPMDLLTVEQYNSFSTGFGAPEGGHISLRIVGVFRAPNAPSGYNSLVATPAFYRAHEAQAIARGLLIRTHRPDGVAVIRAAAARIDADLVNRYGQGQTPYVGVYLPRHSSDPALGPTRAVLRSGLIALLGVVIAAGIILGGQLAGRWAERGRESQSVEHALGFPARERTVARLIAAVPAIALAAGLACAGALLGGFIVPLGSMERYEPHPGWLPRPLYATLGPVLAVVVMTVLVAIATTRAGRRRKGPTVEHGRWRNSLSLRRVALFASALTARGGGPSTSLPVRSMVAGLALMLAALTLVGAIHEQLSTLGDRPASWGWTSDLSVADDTVATDAKLVGDRRISDVERVLDAPVTIRHDGRTVSVTGYGRRTLKGRLPWTVVTGRIPLHVGEVALGPRTAHDLRASVGDDVDFLQPSGRPITVAVVGTVVSPGIENEALGTDVLLTYPGLAYVATHSGFTSALVRAGDAHTRGDLVADLGRRFEVTTPVMPRTIEALDSLGTATRVLLLILLLAAVLLVAQNARLVLRRRGGQIAIADAMGMSRRELAGSVVASVLVTSALAALVGLPLGWAVSRVVLAEIAPRLGIGLSTPDVLPAVLAGAAVLGLTLLVAGIAALFGTRRPSLQRQ